MPNEIWPTTDKVVSQREPIKVPPGPHKVRIYAKDGSGSIEVFPIDAKEAIAGGEYTSEPPVVTEETVVPESTIAEPVPESAPRRGRPKATQATEG